MTAGAIESDGLSRRFGATLAVRPFRLRVGPGGVTGLLGPNGSGKSTLLRMLLGLVRPDTGTARVDGIALRGDGLAVRKRVPYAPGEIATYGEMTGRAHLAWLVAGRGREALRRAVALAEELELPLRRRVRGYSHGMKRQLLVVAALAPEARLRILDEPTEGLDPTKRSQVIELFAREAAHGVTILLSSHHLGEVERVCDRMLFLKEGELLPEDDAHAVHERARRAVRVSWPAAPDAAAIAAAVSAVGGEDLRLRGARATFVLPAGDARTLLFTALEELPPPASFVFGELSLQELYRELYGTEGV